MIDCRLLDIPQIGYDRAWNLMKGLAAARMDGRGGETVILAEHPPVITLGRRGLETDITAPAEDLERRGVLVRRIERGGLATYHGPGQLVVYPVVGLKAVGRGVTECVRGLEEAVIRTLADYGVEGLRREGHPGVFTSRGKISSVGLAVRRGVAFHGLSFNYSPDMADFGLINPCGLSAAEMTSLALILGRAVDGSEVRDKVRAHLADVFGFRFVPFSLEEAEEAAAARRTVLEAEG
jgi:lipoate-protein ligase B